MINALIACCVLGSTCSTGHLVQRQVVSYSQPVVRQVVKQQVAYAAVDQNYAAQTLYFVGAPVRIESYVEQQKRSDPEWQEFQQFKAWRAGAEAQQQAQQQQRALTREPTPQPPPPPMPQPVEPETDRMSLTVSQACGRCHGKAEPDGDFYLDGMRGIEAWRITKAIRAIGDGSMPKNRKLTSHEKNQLLQDLLSLESQDDGGEYE